MQLRPPISGPLPERCSVPYQYDARPAGDSVHNPTKKLDSSLKMTTPVWYIIP